MVLAVVVVAADVVVEAAVEGDALAVAAEEAGHDLQQVRQ